MSLELWVTRQVYSPGARFYVDDGPKLPEIRARTLVLISGYLLPITAPTGT